MYELNKSRQQIYRLINLYKSKGKEGFIHGNCGRTPNNKYDISIIEEIEKLYLNEYYDYNFEAFYDELMENKKYKGKYNITGEVTCFMKKTKCDFMITYNAEYWCEIENNYYKYVKISLNK